MEAHGMPCSECVNLRRGASIASGTFRSILAASRPAAQKAYTEQLKSETDAQISFYEERQRRTKDNTQYGRRPTAPNAQYCGFAEFANAYHSEEVKNLDLDCPDFRQRTSEWGTHTCETCVHNRLLPGRVRMELERVLLRGSDQMKQLMDQIKERVDAQVELEYNTAVFGQGFLDLEPAFLPVCAAWSTDRQYVVGPVVNAGGACDKWVQGAVADDTAATLDSLLAAIVLAERTYGTNHPLLLNRAPPGDDLIWHQWISLRVRSARKDVIGYCMRRMKFPEDFVLQIQETYSLSVSPFEPDDVIEANFARAVDWFVQTFGGPPPGLPQDAFVHRPSGAVATVPVGAAADPVDAAARQSPADPTTSPDHGAETRGMGGIPQAGRNWITGGPKTGGRDVRGGFVAAVLGRSGGPTPEGEATQPPLGGPPERAAGAPSPGPSIDGQPVGAVGDRFLVTPNTDYAHPRREGVGLRIAVGQVQTVVQVRVGLAIYPFDLFAFPQQSWSPIHGPGGQLPVMIRSELPAAVYAVWLE